MVLFSAALLSLGLNAFKPAPPCLARDERRVIVFHDLPPGMPRGLSVLEVDFGPSPVLKPGQPLNAKIKRVLRGGYSADSVPVVLAWSNCSAPFADGANGVIIGRFVRQADGVIVFNPMEESIGQRRMRKGKFSDALL